MPLFTNEISSKKISLTLSTPLPQVSLRQVFIFLTAVYICCWPRLVITNEQFIRTHNTDGLHPTQPLVYNLQGRRVADWRAQNNYLFIMVLRTMYHTSV